ncbi:MAG TPA: aminomethyl-transferring glycine dehydrogenase subunit GcvPB, partial [Caulobacteraceae bacterium]|nr:aminomethyl-transferring glycine dehydrogenase subunit GcvPB [Caulobacteraceae bacterium]
MTMLNVGRATRPSEATAARDGPTPGRGLLQDEPLIFELGGWGKTGVDFETPGDEALEAVDLAALTRSAAPELPGLSEPETLRHYVRLSQQNHAIDLALYP